MYSPGQSSTATAQSPHGEGAGSEISNAELPVRWGESLGFLGHELRNALTSITATTQLMRARPVAEKELAGLAMIERAALRMGHIVSNTLDYAQAVRGSLTIDPQRMNLRSACEDVIEEALAAFPVAIGLTAGYAQWGFWDPIAIAQVLSNIIRSAIVHGAPDAPISVGLVGAPRDSAGDLALDLRAIQAWRGNRSTVPPRPWTGIVRGPWTRGSPSGQHHGRV
jgi:signal transduction histidine kinase